PCPSSSTFFPYTTLFRSHIVETVGELDQKHAHVVGDREQELAQVFRLLGLLGDEIKLFELGQPIDQSPDVWPEHLVDLGPSGLRSEEHTSELQSPDHLV